MDSSDSPIDQIIRLMSSESGDDEETSPIDRILSAEGYGDGSEMRSSNSAGMQPGLQGENMSWERLASLPPALLGELFGGAEQFAGGIRTLGIGALGIPNELIEMERNYPFGLVGALPQLAGQGNPQQPLESTEMMRGMYDDSREKAGLTPEQMLMLELIAPDGSDALSMMRVFHGSKALFPKFDKTHHLTGEGSMVRGKGHYFAENPLVGGEYAAIVPRKDMQKAFLDALPEDSDFDDVMDLLGSGHFSEQQEAVIRALDAEDWLGFDYPSQAINAAYGDLDNFDAEAVRKAVDDSGFLYTANLDVDPDDLLDLDATLSEQSPKVLEALKKAGFPVPRPAKTLEAIQAPLLRELVALEEAGEQLTPRGSELRRQLDSLARELNQHVNAMTGDDLMRGRAGSITNAEGVVMSPEDALLEAGIPGNKFLDRGSRAGGEGTRNIVMFDDDLIDITHINEKPVGGKPKK